MNKVFNIQDVVYPPIGMAHITTDIAHLIEHKIKDVKKVELITAVQPNSHPHLGTITTLMTTYALGKHISNYFSIDTSIMLDILENSPGPEKKHIDGILFQKCLMDIYENDISMSNKFSSDLKIILTFLENKTKLSYKIRSYSEFQADPLVRKLLIKIIKDSKAFSQIMSPSEKKLHIRFPCPICKFMDKHSINVKIEQVSIDYVIMSTICPEHGKQYLNISCNNTDFVDINSGLRDILKGAYIIEEYSRSKKYSATVSGGDWAGTWALRIFCEGLSLLGYAYDGIPFKFYAPLITDWSGAKLSKSLYIESGKYGYLENEFLDFGNFMNTYGNDGLDKLWAEVSSWTENPQKLFRNYSIDYFRLILNKS